MARAELAQFFTPPAVVAFAFDALAALGLRGGRLRIVDPACGEGAFLQEAARRFPEAELWGCDVDAALGDAWEAAGLSGPRVHLRVQDGLVDAPLLGLGAGGFDVVVGNPPFGFGVPRPARGERVEQQFVRRFIELAATGGWVAVVVPEGILANARSQGLRDWVLERAALRAVVALPEATFAATGTRARTALVIAQRGEASAGTTLLAAPGDGAELSDYLADVLAELKSRA
ncbi:MAG: N-6 DNA methylase [Planctomycetota bacterium]